MPLLAFGKNLNWPKKWVRHYNNKSWAEICKKPTTRAQPICKSLKKAMLQDKAKFKWKLVSSDTLEVTFKKYTVKVRRTDDPLVYLVNRRSLYLEEIKNIKQMTKAVEALLPKSESASNIWISAAYANEFPGYELGQIISLLIVQTKESEICETAQKIVKQCKAFDDKLVEKIKSTRKTDSDSLPQLINQQKNLKAAQSVISMSEHFAELFTMVDVTKGTAFTKCECPEGLCQVKEKKTDLSEAYTECKQNVKAIRDLKKAKDLKHLSSELLSEEIDRLTEVVANLEKKKPAENTGGFKEDSYKARQ